MKLTFIIQNEHAIGGGSYSIFKYAEYLAKRGHNVTIFCTLFPSFFEQHTLPTHLKIFHSTRLPIKFKGSEHINRSIAWTFRKTIIEKHIRTHRPDILFGVQRESAILAQTLGNQYGIRTALFAFESPAWVFEERGKGFQKEFQGRLKKSWEQFGEALQKADLVYSNSQLCKSYVDDWIGKETTPIYPGIDIQKPPKKHIQKHQVVYIGRLWYTKRIDDAIRALAQLKNPPTFVICGDGKERSALENLAKGLGVPCQFKGRVSEKEKWNLIAESKCMLFPTEFEGFGMPPMEALLMEVPCICSDIPILREVYGSRVEYFPLGNVSALARKIKSLLSRPIYAKKRGREGRKFVLKTYSWERSAKTIEKSFPPPKPKILVCEATFTCSLAAIRSFGRQGLPVVTADYNDLAIGLHSKYVQQKLLCPPVGDETAFVAWLLDEAKKKTFDIFFPTSDILLWYSVKYASQLSKHCKVYMPPKQTLLSVMLKDQLDVSCRKYGMPTPLTYLPTSLPQLKRLAKSISYPMIIKPRTHNCLHITKKGGVCNTPEELLEKFSSYSFRDSNDPLAKKYPDLIWPMVQEVIPEVTDNIFAVNGYCDRNGKCIGISILKKIRQRPARVGIAVCAQSVKIPQLELQTKNYLKKICYEGIFAIEFIYDTRDKQYKLIDFNPRTPAFTQFLTDLGHDLCRLWYQDVILKQKLSTCSPVKSGLYYIHFFHDLFFLPGQFFIRRKIIDPLLHYEKTLTHVKTYAVLSLDDPLPLVFDLWVYVKRIFHIRSYLRNIIKGE